MRWVMRCRSGGLGCLLTVSGEAAFPLFGNTKQIFNGLHDNAGWFAREWYPLVNGQLSGAGINTDPHPATQGFDSLLPERSDELGRGGLRDRCAEHNRDSEADIVLVTVYRELPRRPFFRGGLVYFAGEQVVRGKSPAVLGCGLVGPWAALQRLGGAFLGRGGMYSVVGPAATVDEGLTCSTALRLVAPETVAIDCASRRCSKALWT